MCKKAKQRALDTGILEPESAHEGNATRGMMIALAIEAIVVLIGYGVWRLI
jgi:hypothetical protein